MSRRPRRSPLIGVPDAERFGTLAREVFEAGVLTNNGPKARELEARLADYLGVEHLVLTSSGTLALQVAYRALGLTGEVITSPFSWTTTASSLCWVGLKPRFADIDPHTFNIDPRAIEPEITAATSAVLAVHTFGNPCDIAAIEDMAARHGLRTVYDAAHAFGVGYAGKSVFAFGDACVLSLHATKLFHTVEGGAVILRDAETCRRARLIINNGADEQQEVLALGINGRMSELHAAVGLTLLDNAVGVLRRRRVLAEALRGQLRRASAVQLQRLNGLGDVNHAYFPIVLPDSEVRRRVIEALDAAGFRSRVYFANPLNRLPFIEDRRGMPFTESLCSRILCLLFGPEASSEEVRVMGEVVAGICPVDDVARAAVLAGS
jgi:dTDP-4-amino-4,6-dideoxygalactose transaminase